MPPPWAGSHRGERHPPAAGGSSREAQFLPVHGSSSHTDMEQPRCIHAPDENGLEMGARCSSGGSSGSEDATLPISSSRKGSQLLTPLSARPHGGHSSLLALPSTPQADVPLHSPAGLMSLGSETTLPVTLGSALCEQRLALPAPSWFPAITHITPQLIKPPQTKNGAVPTPSAPVHIASLQAVGAYQKGKSKRPSRAANKN